MNRKAATGSARSPLRRRPRLFSGFPALPGKSGSHGGDAQLLAVLAGQARRAPNVDVRPLDPGTQRLAGDPQILRDLGDRPAAVPGQLDRLTPELLGIRGTSAWHGHHILPAGSDGPSDQVSTKPGALQPGAAGTALVPRQQAAGLIDGESFNLDFHAIMSYGEDQILEEHYVPRRSQRTRAVLTFFAQDSRHATLCYANTDITKADQAHEIIRFCEFWQARAPAQPPGLLVFDSTLTTHDQLGELDDRAIGFITLRRRGATLMNQVAALPTPGRPCVWSGPANTAT